MRHSLALSKMTGKIWSSCIWLLGVYLHLHYLQERKKTGMGEWNWLEAAGRVRRPSVGGCKRIAGSGRRHCVPNVNGRQRDCWWIYCFFPVKRPKAAVEFR